MIGKVQCDRAFMARHIKAGNMNKKTHCDIVKMRSKEEKSSASRLF
jgi:hypothetical protein